MRLVPILWMLWVIGVALCTQRILSLSVALTADAKAQPLVLSSHMDSPFCSRQFDPFAGLKFEHDKYRRWYRRFWNDRCEGLSFFDFCLENGDSWTATMEALMPRVRGMERKALQSALCFLGQKIGHE